MSEMIFFSLIMLASVFVAACSQILLKAAASSQYKSRLAEYLNARVIIAYVMFVGTAVVGILVLRYIPLSFVPILESSAYVFIPVLGRFFLKEQISGRQLAGTVLIIAGIYISICRYA